MAQTEAQKAAKAAEKEAAEKARQVEVEDPLNPGEMQVVEHLERIEETGVILDTTDANYENLKEIEQLRADVLVARQELLAGSVERAVDVDAAQQEVEKVRLRAELQAIRNQQAAQGGGVAAVMSQVEEQRSEAESQLAAQQAAQTEGN